MSTATDHIQVDRFTDETEARDRIETMKDYGFNFLEGFNTDVEDGWEIVLKDEFGDTASVIFEPDQRPVREAIVLGENNIERIAAFLPSDYSVEVRPELHDEGDKIVIFGHDNAGWTLDGYVIPRLASGMIFAQEVN